MTMMLLARAAILAAALTTMWFNGSYAWSKAGEPVQQLGLVALALTIDLGKCSFLAVASGLWRDRYRLRALVLALVWPLLFLFSTFCGYAAIVGNRVTSAAVADGQLEQQMRTRLRYDTAIDDLKAAKASPLWSATAACTTPRTNVQRRYCERIAALQKTAGEVVLGDLPSRATGADPELALLREAFALSAAHLTLLVTILPALLIELMASLGGYAVQSERLPRQNRTAAEAVSGAGAGSTSPDQNNTPEGRDIGAAVGGSHAPAVRRPAPAGPPIAWPVLGKR